MGNVLIFHNGQKKDFFELSAELKITTLTTKRNSYKNGNRNIFYRKISTRKTLLVLLLQKFVVPIQNTKNGIKFDAAAMMKRKKISSGKLPLELLFEIRACVKRVFVLNIFLSD